MLLKNKLEYLFGFLAVLVVLLLSAPANHSEAEDTYYYARMVECGEWGDMFHGHHLLYLPMSRLLYSSAQVMGYEGRALPLLVGISMISAAVAVCLFSALLRGNGVRKGTAWAFAGALMFSYGFWRYGVAAEIYLPALAFAMAALVSAQLGRLWFCICFSAAALLFHLVCIPVVLMAIPLFYVLRKQFRFVWIHIGVVSVLVSGVYGFVALRAGFTLFPDEMVMRSSLVQPVTWAKGIFAFGQSLLSGNFLFVMPGVADQLVAMFPYHMLQEEVFMGAQAPAWMRWFAPFSFVVTSTGLIALIGFAMRRNDSVSSMAWAGVAWLIGSAGMAMWFEPANPEMWIFTIPAFWLVIGAFWNEVSGGIRWLPFVAAVLFAVHNFSGGMLLVRGEKGDYCRQKGTWIMEHTAAGDVVLVADSHSFTTYLQYWCSARVIDMKFRPLAEWENLDKEGARAIYVFGDVLAPLPPVARRDSASVDNLRKLGLVIKPQLDPVHQTAFGIIYKWRPQ